ncbi:hypothetical protein M431DRAFT_324746 [Trichoderma harzianum CBS 226.95]|uniref:Uncharacterized protein n=1 Tax=Trichoderma harzianum CBS 226.95 TaxID=983964 RepID=A0A2T3ZUM0_TRIHA|nr:hypothetical protein M431DRAFT_324746 [Trichoderma harzianum CBS 226.95]PTB48511.1 hypothetical protein M431DRAFT_324746 [Trichoderma harzianum CBS 226.95]
MQIKPNPPSSAAQSGTSKKIIASAPSPESFKTLRPRYKQRNEIALLKCRRSPSPLAVRSLSAPLASCLVLLCPSGSRHLTSLTLSLSALPSLVLFHLALAAPVESGQRAASQTYRWPHLRTNCACRTVDPCLPIPNSVSS